MIKPEEIVEKANEAVQVGLISFVSSEGGGLYNDLTRRSGLYQIAKRASLECLKCISLFPPHILLTLLFRFWMF